MDGTGAVGGKIQSLVIIDITFEFIDQSYEKQNMKYRYRFTCVYIA